MARLSPRVLALEDSILAALTDGPGTTDEIAGRIGNVACACLHERGTAGIVERRDGTTYQCTACRGQEPAGWRPAYGFDVYRRLVRLERLGKVAGLRTVEYRQVMWAIDPSYIPTTVEGAEA